jgi:hypothetical protein
VQRHLLQALLQQDFSIIRFTSKRYNIKRRRYGFTWKDKRDELVHIGYVAQEVQENYLTKLKNKEMLSINYIEVLVAKFKN